MTGPRPAPGPAELRYALKPGLGLLIWAFVFSLFANLLMLTGPLYMLQIYDRVLSSRSVETLIALSVLVAGLYALMALFDYARGHLMTRAGARFRSALDERVFEAGLEPGQERGEAAAAVRSLDALHKLFVSPVLLTVMDLPWTPIFLALMFLFHPMIGWTAVAGGTVLVLLAVGNHVFSTRQARDAQSTWQSTHDFATEARTGEEVVVTQGMRPVMTERWARQRVEGLRQELDASDWIGSFTSVARAFRLLLQSAVLGVGALYTLQGDLTGGAMIAGAILLGRAMAPVEHVLAGWQVLHRARTSWTDLGAYLAETPFRPTGTTLPVPAADLEVTGVAVVPPGGGIPALRGVSFRLQPGQAIGVVGPTGAGKSTLARAILGYWPVGAGEIRLGGLAIDQYGAEALGSHIGYLPQDVRLFSGSIAQNIARMALEPDTDAIILAAKAANAHDVITALPDGYDTMLVAGDLKLSGGQCQRIALARALYDEPQLLILDEPNSALDSDGSEALNAAVRRFKARGGGAVIMTHRPDAIVHCDMLLVLEAGTVKFFGTQGDATRRMSRGAGGADRTLRSVDGGAP